MKKRTIAIAAVSIVLLVGGTVWALKNRPDPQMLKVQEIQKELFAGEGRPDREKMQQFHQEMEKLTPEQQEVFHDQREQRRESFENKMVADYFALSPEQQTAYLDKQIQEEEKRRKDRESRRNQNGQGQNRMGPGPNATGQGPGAGPGGRGGNRTPEQRSLRLNKRLDRASPLQRSQQTAYRQALAIRRAQLGLPPMGGPGGGRPRG